MTRSPDWWLVDVQDRHDLRVVVGPGAGPGATLARALRNPTRRLLPVAVEQVMATRTATVHELESQGATWRVSAYPVLSRAQAVVAVIGAVTPATDPVATPPLIGVWDWDIASQTGVGNDDLFALARIPEEFWPTGHHFGFAEWLEGLSAADVSVAHDVFLRCANAPEPSPQHCMVLRNRTDGTSSAELLYGRPTFGDESDRSTGCLGVTLDVSEHPVLGKFRSDTSDVLEAAAEFLPSGTALLTPADQHVLRWLADPTPEVGWPADPYLADVVAGPAERARLRRWGAELESSNGGRVAPLGLRMIGVAGGQVAVRVESSPVGRARDGSAWVVVKMTAV